MVKCVAVDISCNDHRNGNFSGEFHGLQIGDVLGLFSPFDSIECEYKFGDGKTKSIVIDGIDIQVYRRVEWFGNWCWDRIWISIDDVMSLLRILKDRGWCVEEGDETLTSLYDHQNIKPSDLMDCLNHKEPEYKDLIIWPMY